MELQPVTDHPLAHLSPTRDQPNAINQAPIPSDPVIENHDILVLPVAPALPVAPRPFPVVYHAPVGNPDAEAVQDRTPSPPPRLMTKAEATCAIRIRRAKLCCFLTIFVLITAVCGFIGLNLAYDLLARSEDTSIWGGALHRFMGIPKWSDAKLKCQEPLALGVCAWFLTIGIVFDFGIYKAYNLVTSNATQEPDMTPVNTTDVMRTDGIPTDVDAFEDRALQRPVHV